MSTFLYHSSCNCNPFIYREISNDSSSFYIEHQRTCNTITSNFPTIFKNKSCIKDYREEKMGTPGSVAPASTMKTLPVTYSEESSMRYRTRDVTAGFDVPNVLNGTVFVAMLLSHCFCMRPSVISDLNKPGLIEFTLILCTPSSNAITCKLSQ